jgi:GNAT superfamily N-acetyltransferase
MTVECVRVEGEPGSSVFVYQACEWEELVGTVRALTMPDQRTVLSFRDCRDDAYEPLLGCLDADLGCDFYTAVDERDRTGLDRLSALGFSVARREYAYRVPVTATHRSLADILPPSGITLLGAADADLDRLRLLDDALRQDTPGSDGWRWTPEEFREETFSDGFDPATYLVAVEEGSGEYVGITRLWMKAAGPRFGFVGVLPRWRRTRVTYALLATVFGEVRRRGHGEVAAEIDATNRASNGIAARVGAVRVGGTLHLHRRAVAQ